MLHQFQSNTHTHPTTPPIIKFMERSKKFVKGVRRDEDRPEIFFAVLINNSVSSTVYKRRMMIFA